MGKPGIDGNVAPQGFEDIEYLGELEIFFAAMRKPAPVFEGWILLQRHGHAVGQVKAGKPFALHGPLYRAGHPSEGFEPRQGQGHAGAAKKFPAIK